MPQWNHGVCARPISKSRCPAQRAEAALGFVLPVGGQVALRTQGQVNTLVEVFPGLTVSSPHLVGDVDRQERPQPVAEFLVLRGEFDAREIHDR